MQERSLGITALAVLAVMVGIYSFMAAVALLWGGAIVAFVGVDVGSLVFALGVLFVGQSIAAYVVGVGVWMQKSWAWAGSVTILTTLTVLNVVLGLAAMNFSAVLLPLIGTVVGLTYLYRSSTKAALLGEPAPDEPEHTVLGEVAKTTA